MRIANLPRVKAIAAGDDHCVAAYTVGHTFRSWYPDFSSRVGKRLVECQAARFEAGTVARNLQDARRRQRVLLADCAKDLPRLAGRKCVFLLDGRVSGGGAFADSL